MLHKLTGRRHGIKIVCRYSLFAVFVIMVLVTFLFYISIGRGRLVERDEKECYSRLVQLRDNKRDIHGDFPDTIHQIYFGIDNKVMPGKWLKAQQTWKDYHPTFQYILWNSTMVESLIRSKYPEFMALYEAYSHWVRKTDFARYLLLYDMGGVYVDLDIQAVTSLYNFLYISDNQQSQTLLYWTAPFGVSNDFMVSKLHSDFLAYVLCGLSNANRWFVSPYLTTMMTTGPIYLTMKYGTYSDSSSVKVLNVTNLTPYIRHIQGSSWHQLDGVIIWWLYRHRMAILIAITMFIVLHRVVSKCYKVMR